MTALKIQNALISVSDKTGLADFARRLTACGIALYSTGGTRRFLAENGIPTRDVADYTGFPEMMDGRIKTLHPKVHGGILARLDESEDRRSLEEHGIVPFGLVVVNLYPFQQTVSRPGVSDSECVEQIDIGGPSMVRAAAKNHRFVNIVTDATQYADVLAQIEATETTDDALRRRLAGEAFEHTARYDRGIADYFARPAADRGFPQTWTASFDRGEVLRYGENPHQQAAVYRRPGAGEGTLVGAKKLHGKELSYNNLLDLDSALAIVRGCAGPAVSVIKHNNPCGAAVGASPADAARKALDADPVSAFGSILGFNRAVDAATAALLAEPDRFIEAIIAPGYEPAAFEILTTRPKWKSNVRLLEIAAASATRGADDWDLRRIDGGLLLQTVDDQLDPESDWKMVTAAHPTEEQWADLRFAWSVVRHVKSNAIVLARRQTLCGVGAGQMSRVDSTNIAIQKAGEQAQGAALGSDAFFPFPDSIHSAAAAGVKCVIQPGGSKNDPDVIVACDQHGIAMIFTGRRHFKH